MPLRRPVEYISGAGGDSCIVRLECDHVKVLWGCPQRTRCRECPRKP
jgi:hypothetical protein